MTYFSFGAIFGETIKITRGVYREASDMKLLAVTLNMTINIIPVQLRSVVVPK